MGECFCNLHFYHYRLWVKLSVLKVGKLIGREPQSDPRLSCCWTCTRMICLCLIGRVMTKDCDCNLLNWVCMLSTHSNETLYYCTFSNKVVCSWSDHLRADSCLFREAKLLETIIFFYFFYFLFFIFYFKQTGNSTAFRRNLETIFNQWASNSSRFIFFWNFWAISYEFLKLKYNGQQQQPSKVYTIGTLRREKFTPRSWSILEQNTL